MLRERETRRLIGAGLALAAGLMCVVWLDSRATRHELLALLRDQATSLRETVAAAARSNRQAGREVERQLAARLLDNARLLAELDRQGALDQALLDDVVRRHQLFRVNTYAPDGAPELAGGSGGGRRGRGRGGPVSLAHRLIDGGEAEATTEVHRSRWGEARVAAGVRRVDGGAIVLNVDASAAAALERQLSLDALIADVIDHAPEVAYVVFEQESLRIQHGEAPPREAPSALEENTETLETVAGRPVLELAGPVDLGTGATAALRLGMRLDGVRAAERRMLWQLGLSLGVSLALAAAGGGALWLRRRYGVLSERHARAEAELRRRDRLAAMGELASGVAHEIRNPLNAIAMTARRLRSEFRGSPVKPSERTELDELLDVLESETRRIDATVQQFLEYARPQPLSPRLTDVGRLAEETGGSVRALAESRGVTLAVEVGTAGEAVVDPLQLRQVIENLLRNAIEATPENGRVALRARRDAHSLVIEVSDTGPGIEPDALPRIFDLYFTTKPGGTGVGLAVTQQIVSAHGGSLDVDSKPGAGTTFTLRLSLQPDGSAES